MSKRADIALRVGVTVLSAAFLALLSAPANLHYLHWFAYLPFFWVLRDGETKPNRWLAFLYGTVAVAVIFRWIPDTIVLFSNIPMVGGLALGLLFSMAFGLPYFAVWAAVHPMRRRLGDAWILAFPAWLVTVEWLSMNVLLFPYQQGVTQFQFPFTWQLASVTGVWGLSFLVMFVNAALAEGIYREREGRPFPVLWVCASVVTLSCVVFYGAWRFERIETALRSADVLTYQQIQLDTTMQYRLDTGRKVAFEDWAGETKKVPPGSVDMVIWSEGASAYNPAPDMYNSRHADLAALARRGQFELLLGGGTIELDTDERGRPVRDADGNIDYTAFNSVYLIGTDGDVKGRYDKNVPLPFGEYLPLGWLFPGLAEMIGGIGNFQAGATANNIDSAKVSLSAPICYEAILPATCRKFPNPGLMVNVTNDAWFSYPATYQHGMLAAIRSTELGIPLIRVAYTGTSFVTEPHGHIYATTEMFERVNRPVAVRLGHYTTFYSRWGNWFVYLCIIGLLGAWLAAPWRKRSGMTLPPDSKAPPVS